MASSDSAGSFEAIIHKDRTRKKNEDLANQIFGRRNSNQNVKKQQQKEPRSPSLASRMGVQKRHSASTTPTQARENPFNPPSRPSSTTPSQRNARANRIQKEIESGNANVANTSNSARPKPARNGASTSGHGISIKGSAGPFTLHASNFADGTTEADIESALHTELFDDAGNNCLQACRVISTRPSVLVEMVFSEKSVADKIVSKFNNLRADGRILKVEFVAPGTTSSRASTARPNGGSVAQSVEQPVDDAPMVGTEGDMEVDASEMPPSSSAYSAYDHEREAADRDRRDRDRDYRRDDRRDDRDRDRRRDDRDRDRDRDRDQDRERDPVRDDQRRDSRRDDASRDRDRDRDRDYDRRDPQPQPQPQPPYGGTYNRPPAPVYGNGYSRPPRGNYGGYGGRGGYGRGGYGFPRGGGYGRGYGDR